MRYQYRQKEGIGISAAGDERYTRRCLSLGDAGSVFRQHGARSRVSSLRRASHPAGTATAFAACALWHIARGMPYEAAAEFGVALEGVFSLRACCAVGGISRIIVGGDKVTT
jgi:hypothetical protein